MTLTVLKNGGRWDFLAKLFDMKAPTFERIIMRHICSISDFMYHAFFRHVEKHIMMDLLIDEKKRFKNFKGDFYAT